MNNNIRNFWLLMIIAFGLFTIYNMFDNGNEQSGAKIIDYSAFRTAVTQNQVSEVILKGDTVVGRQNDGQKFITRVPENNLFADDLASKGVKVEAVNRDENYPSLFSVLISWFPILLFIGVWVYFYRQMQSGGGGKSMGFGKSKAKMLTEDKLKITFKDVAGIEEAKDELVEIVDFLKDPEKFHRIGGRIPKGVLLMGSPGTGKTLLAKAIAGEAQVPFFSISGSDFVEMFVGVGASRVRDMFVQAKKNCPCIIFIDEIDAVGRHRGAGVGGGNDEREQTLNQLLVEMDGFDENESVIIIAATNRPDVLDPALMRPGRFDRQVVVPLPDLEGREAILKVHMRKVSLADDINAKVIARGTPGFSGADLSNLVNEAALLAARLNKRVVSMAHLEEAKDKVMMGAERRSMIMTDEEKKLTAYHEGGHALVAYYMEDSDPIHKATIIPRGRALGMVMRLPEKDQISVTLAKLKADIAVAMGGRIAEEIIFGREKVTTGASSDIRMATDLAKRMVMEWGLSEKLGPLAYGAPQQEVFLGHSVTQTQDMSEKTQELVDQEIRRSVDDGYDVACKLIKKHIKQLHALAEAMLEFETLSGDDIDKIMKGKKLDRDPPAKGKKKAVKKSKSSIPGMSGPTPAPQGA